MPHSIWAPKAERHLQSVMLLPRKPTSYHHAQALLQSKLERLLRSANRAALLDLADHGELYRDGNNPKEIAEQMIWTDPVSQALQVWANPPELQLKDLLEEYREQTLASLVEDLTAL